MKHVKALGIKFAITSIVLFSILTIFETAVLGEIFFISVLITGMTYIIGDLLILPKFGYFMVAVADFCLASIAISGLSALYIGAGPSILIASLAAGFIMTIGESIFHIYMKEKVLNNQEVKNDYFHYRNQIQTEFAEEDIHDRKPQSDKD